MLEFQKLSIRPALEKDKSFCFKVKKATMQRYIENTWGWDERFQINFHNRDWQSRKPDIVLYGKEDIGTIYIVEEEKKLFLHEITILPDFQNKGIGSYFLKHLIRLSEEKKKLAKLQVLKVNPAKSLYIRFGFKDYDQTETHYLMERLPTT